MRRDVVAGPSPVPAPMTLRAGDLAAPSPFLGGVAQADVERVAPGRVRAPARVSPRFTGGADPRTVPADPRAPSRVRASDVALLDVAIDLSHARTGVRSARATALPPPSDS